MTDGNGGANVVYLPPLTAAIANSATINIDAPSSETVTFNGGTGSTSCSTSR